MQHQYTDSDYTFARPTRMHDVYVRQVRVPVSKATGPAPDMQRESSPHLSAKLFNLVRASGLVALLLAVIGLGMGNTLSFYGDIERSTGNTLATGGVDFVLVDTPFAHLASSTDWQIDVVPEDFSNPFYYYASSTNFHGNLDLCDALTVTAYQDGVIMYQGPLTELRTATTTSLASWTYDFDNFEAFAGQTCHFDISYHGWQTRHNMTYGGYSDIEVASYWLTVPSLLLTKVYFDYDAGETCTDKTAATTVISGAIQFALTNDHLPDCEDVSQTQEWVEIYNISNEPVDVSGWHICDAYSCDMLVATNPIEPGEYGLIAGVNTIHTEISIPWGVELMLIPDGQIGSGLFTAGGMLELRGPDTMAVDALNWGTVDPFWPHYNAMLWPSDSLTATSGAALARLPVDVDTNSPADWQVLGIPAVALLNPSSTTISVAPGELVDITWTAENLNGPDEDLKIDLYWFDTTDGLHLIVLETANDGLYEWLVPDGLTGDVRIKIVATGPENPLLNTRILTERIPVVSGRSVQAFARTSAVATTSASTTDQGTSSGGDKKGEATPLPAPVATSSDMQILEKYTQT